MENNKIHFGSCFDLIKKLESNTIDLIVTSPPYANATTYGKNIDCFDTEHYCDWFLPLAKEIARVMSDTGSFILNINDKIDNGFRSTYVYELIHRINKETDMKLYERYIWYKKSGLPTGGDKRLNDKIEYLFHFTKTKKHKAYVDRIRIPYTESSINRFKSPVLGNDSIDENGLTTNSKKKMVDPNPLGKKPDGVMRFNSASALKGDTAGVHPAAYHPDLPYFFINWLTDENDLVLDPFMGTGTTAQVCKKMNRNFIGFELNESYREVQGLKLSDSEVDKLELTSIRDIFNNKIGEF